MDTEACSFNCDMCNELFILVSVVPTVMWMVHNSVQWTCNSEHSPVMCKIVCCCQNLWDFTYFMYTLSLSRIGIVLDVHIE